MATELQRDLAEAIVANKKLPRDKRKNKKELVASVGYSTKVATHKQKEIIGAKGVKEALAEYGLTEELITTSLVYDIKGKPKSRVKELSLGAEILGMRKEKPNGNTTNILNIFTDEQLKRAAREYLASKEDLRDMQE